MKSKIRCWCCIDPQGYPLVSSISYTGKKDCISKFVADIPEPYRWEWDKYVMKGWACKKVVLTAEIDESYYKRLKK